jgi:putative protein kinase ArgK-like GTPase of G3E family
MDVPEAKDRLAELRRSFARRKVKPEILAISAVTGEGLERLLDAVARQLSRQEPGATRVARKKVGKPRAKAQR